jgi:hypothetical protein
VTRSEDASVEAKRVLALLSPKLGGFEAESKSRYQNLIRAIAVFILDLKEYEGIVISEENRRSVLQLFRDQYLPVHMTRFSNLEIASWFYFKNVSPFQIYEGNFY